MPQPLFENVLFLIDGEEGEVGLSIAEKSSYAREITRLGSPPGLGDNYPPWLNTSEFKYGTGSLGLPDASYRYTVANDPEAEITGPFSLEFDYKIYDPDFYNGSDLCGIDTGGDEYIVIRWNNDDTMEALSATYTSEDISDVDSTDETTWRHFAWERDSDGINRVYNRGVLMLEFEWAGTFTVDKVLLGGAAPGNPKTPGWFDNIRFCNVLVYESDFTPPTGPHPLSDPGPPPVLRQRISYRLADRLLSVHNIAYWIRLRPKLVFTVANASRMTAKANIAYGLYPRLLQKLKVSYPLGPRLLQRLKVSNADSVRMSQKVSYAFFDRAGMALRVSYGLFERIKKEFEVSYALESVKRLRRRFSVKYAITDAETHIITQAPFLFLDGEVIEVLSAEISTDEGSVKWDGTFNLANVEDIQRFTINKPFVAIFLGEEFNFLVEGRALSRPEISDTSADRVATVYGISPVVQYEFPRAKKIEKTWETDIKASAIAQEMVPGITWATVDFTVQGNKFGVNASSPIDVVKKLAEVVGAVVESAPDGAIQVRPKFPVSVPQYSLESADFVLDDEKDNFSYGERYSPTEMVDKLLILDEVQGSQRDNINYEQDQYQADRGVLKVYPAVWRETCSVRATGPVSSLYYRGIVVETKVEIVEFTNGKGTTQAPIIEITSAIWHTDSLGTPKFDFYKNELTAPSVNGYSLLKLTYKTKYHAFNVIGPANTSVQFVVEN